MEAGKLAQGPVRARRCLPRDVMPGLANPCRKLRLSFFAYLGDRLGLNTGQPKIPPLAVLVTQA